MTHCTGIQIFAKNVYDFLSDVFTYNLKFSELGLTDHLLHHLASYSKYIGSNNIEIYKLPWSVESIYGNDIDLFIQNKLGTFNWYALQAKVMSPNGAFTDIRIKPKSTQQWDKLLNHERTFGSKTYYLLYCGESRRPPKKMPTRADCLGIPTVQDYGTTIVETKDIKHIRTSVLSTHANLYFNDVFPNHTDTLRKLFCCVDSLPKTGSQFSRSQISTKGYQKIYFDDSVQEDQNNENDQSLEDGFAPVRIIISSINNDFNNAI